MTVRSIGFACVAVTAACLAGICLGQRIVHPTEALAAFAGGGDPAVGTLLFDLRLPRLTAALLIGAILGLAGGLLQGATRNVLAEPGLLGIHAGAGLAVIALFVIVDPLIANHWMSVASCAGGAVAALLVWWIAGRDGRTRPATLLLTGIAVAAGLGALATALAFAASPETFARAQIWNTGSLTGLGWNDCLLLAATMIACLAAAVALARPLDVLALGDATATTLGARPQRVRLAAIAVAVAGASLCAAVGGGIAFVGLLAPNLARWIVGQRHRPMLLVAACCGAAVLAIADTLARTVAGTGELPTGILVAVVGTPYFLWLLVHR